jgi:MFS family permease
MSYGRRTSLEGTRTREQGPDVGELFALAALAFGVFGIWAGSSAVLLADLSRSIGLSTGPLGVALFAGAAASMVSMWSLGWTADRFGRKAYLIVVTGVFGLGTVGLVLAGSFAALVAVFVVPYYAAGLYDVGINAAAVDLERLSGRRQMSFLHALYAVGAAFGSLGAGALLSADVGFRLVYLALLVPLAAVAVGIVFTSFPNPDGVRAESSPEAVEEGTSRWGLYRNAPLLLVAAIAGLGFVSEMVMETWSGIYLRDTLGLGALLGGSGVAVFFGAMALGRFGTGWAVTRLGNRRVLLGAGVLTACGMALAPVTTLPALIICGFLLVGMAISGMAPLAQSAAGDLFPQRAGAATSVVITFSSGGGLLATPLVGGMAEVTGLRAALGLVVVAGLAVLVLSTRLREPKAGRSG